MTATPTHTPALVVMDEARWQGMGWHARQQWLNTANTLRRQLVDDLNERLADEAARHATRRAYLEQCDEAARAQRILDGLRVDPDGPKRLHALGEAIARADGLRQRPDHTNPCTTLTERHHAS